MKHSDDCLHCLINREMDKYNERQHLATGHPVNVDNNVVALMSVAAELLAMYGDAKLRKFMVKQAQGDLASLTRQCREDGRYPGGPGAHSAGTLKM